MVHSSLIHTKDLFILIAKRHQNLSYRRWWIIRGNYGNCGNGRSITFHETKLYQTKIYKIKYITEKEYLTYISVDKHFDIVLHCFIFYMAKLIIKRRK